MTTISNLKNLKRKLNVEEKTWKIHQKSEVELKLRTVTKGRIRNMR